MKKNYLLSLILFCCLFSCGQSSIDNRRKDVMTKIVKAIIKNDTIEIYKLVDTSYCFSIIGKEGFMHNLYSLHAALSKEQAKVDQNDFLLADKFNASINTTYKISFRLKKSEFDSVEIKFSFSDDLYRFVYFMDTDFKRNKYPPLDAAPTGCIIHKVPMITSLQMRVL